jgi:hypothetical protein
MKGLFDLKAKILKAGSENCFILETTLAELKFGVENSQAKEKNAIALARKNGRNQNRRLDQVICNYVGIDIFFFDKSHRSLEIA